MLSHSLFILPNAHQFSYPCWMACQEREKQQKSASLIEGTKAFVVLHPALRKGTLVLIGV